MPETALNKLDTAPTTKRPPGRPKRSSNDVDLKNQILDAARAIIFEEGIPALSYSKIAQKIGVSKGTVNYHFESKEALLVALMEAHAEQIERRYQVGLAEARKRFEDPVPFAFPEWAREFLSRSPTEPTTFGLMIQISMAYRDLKRPDNRWYREAFEKFSNYPKEAEMTATVAALAAQGLFFMKFLGMNIFEKERSDEILTYIEKQITEALKEDGV